MFLGPGTLTAISRIVLIEASRSNIRQRMSNELFSNIPARPRLVATRAAGKHSESERGLTDKSSPHERMIKCLLEGEWRTVVVPQTRRHKAAGSTAHGGATH